MVYAKRSMTIPQRGFCCFAYFFQLANNFWVVEFLQPLCALCGHLLAKDIAVAIAAVVIANEGQGFLTGREGVCVSIPIVGGFYPA